MEDETQLSSEVPVTKAVENTEAIKVVNGDIQVKKDDEETALDGEFIKVEKEQSEPREDKSVVIERSSSNSSRELLEAQEKVRDLELELQRLAGALKSSETSNSQLKNDVSSANEKLSEAEAKHVAQLDALRAASETQEAKHAELAEAKKAFEGLGAELASSRKRMEELERELEGSASEARKLGELHAQSGSKAEAELRRATEFEALLEEARLGAEKAEQKMAALQDEVKGLCDRVAENEKIEAALNAAMSDASAAHAELAASKSLVVGLEGNLAELTAELERRTVSEAKKVNELEDAMVKSEAALKAATLDASAAHAELAASKSLVVGLEGSLAELTAELERRTVSETKKVNELEDATVKIEAALKAATSDASAAHAELAASKSLVVDLEANLAGLTADLEQRTVSETKLVEKVNELEDAKVKIEVERKALEAASADLAEKLKVSDENFGKSDSLLTQALANCTELELKLKSLEDLHTERSVEHEGIVRSSNAATEETKSKLRETETRLIEAEQKNVELEQKLNLVELKSNDAEREFSEKAAELSAALKDTEEEKAKSCSRVSELEEELKILVAKSAEHEDRATVHHQRGLELEDLIKASHEKAEGSSKKASDLELLLETEKYRIQELEEQIVALEKKNSDKVADLGSELEAFQARSASLEIALQASMEKEKELIEEKKKLEIETSSTGSKLAEAENLLQVVRSELSETNKKLESIECDLKTGGVRESEIIEKLNAAEGKLAEQERLIDQATERNIELEMLHETLKSDSEVRVQEAVANYSSRDTEAKSLFEKLSILEEQVRVYEEQIAESASKSASLASENEGLRRKISEAEEKTSQSFSENELLVQTNVQLKTKLNELQELFESTLSEKETFSQQLESHKTSVAELTDTHSRAIELHSATEAQLHESLHKFTQRDLEASELTQKLGALELELSSYQAQIHEASSVSELRKTELEETFLKLKHLESIVEELQSKSAQVEAESKNLSDANRKLAEQATEYETKLCDLQEKLSSTLAEKEETREKLNSSAKTVEDLKQQLASEGEKLQSQISSVMDENNLLNETHQSTKKELQCIIIQLENELKEHKENVDSLKGESVILKAEISEKSALQSRLEELEKELVKAEARLKEEVETVQSASAARETELKSKLEDQKVRDRNLLDDQITELQRDLQLSREAIDELKKDVHLKKGLEHETAAKQSQEVVANLEQQVKDLEHKLKEKAEVNDGVEVKSRDIGLNFSTPTKRKSKKKTEIVTGQPSSSSETTQTQTVEHSPMMTFKFILGVALVSVIIGIVLGKKY